MTKQERLQAIKDFEQTRVDWAVLLDLLESFGLDYADRSAKFNSTEDSFYYLERFLPSQDYSLTMIEIDNFTIIHLLLPVGMLFTGVSKRNPRDRRNRLVAIQRALSRLGQSIVLGKYEKLPATFATNSVN